ncbi:MAG: CAP domain-containing protein, partial [Acidimicrobiia bacterium]
ATLGGADSAGASPAEEGDFVSLINQARTSNGLTTLSIKSDLVGYARRHTEKMIASGSIFHSTSAELSSASTGWVVLGENVGRGKHASSLHTAFMNSPSHRANVLGDFDRIGVGANRSADGVLFVTVIFMKSKDAPTTTTTTTLPSTTTTTTPPVATTANPTTTSTTQPPATTATPTTTTTTTTTPDTSQTTDADYGLDLAAWSVVLSGVEHLILDLRITDRATPCFRTTHSDFLCID